VIKGKGCGGRWKEGEEGKLGVALRELVDQHRARERATNSDRERTERIVKGDLCGKASGMGADVHVMRKTVWKGGGGTHPLL